MAEGVVPGVDGPNDFVERFDCLARRGGDGVDALGSFVRLAAVLMGKFAEQGNLGKVCDQIVVNVFGDTGAFLVQSSLLLKVSQVQPQSSKRDISNNGNNAPRECAEGTQPKPPRLPKEREHRNTQRRGLAPLSQMVAGSNLETVIACGQSGIGRAARAWFSPIFSKTFQSITKPYVFRAGKTWGGEFEFQAAMIGRKLQNRLRLVQIECSRANHVGDWQRPAVPGHSSFTRADPGQQDRRRLQIFTQPVRVNQRQRGSHRHPESSFGCSE